LTLGKRLVVQTLTALLVMFAGLFLTAGTFHYWEAWVFIAAVLIPLVIFFAYYYKHDPAVVERRLQRKEMRERQKWVMRFAAGVSSLGFVIPGFDHRFGWTRQWFGGVPLWAEISALAIVFVGYVGTMWVIDVNRFASRTIQVEQGQKVVSRGPYRLVRHPMYMFVLLMWIAVGPALGSLVALPFLALEIPVLVFRLLDEERMLRNDLPGYQEYCRATPHRLIPFLW
jgi:protein-S-isoprenylcysteine O-methyltransferase Ste14